MGLSATQEHKNTSPLVILELQSSDEKNPSRREIPEPMSSTEIAPIRLDG